MQSIDFLRPRLVGARFDGHAIPLEFLKDLAVLEEMIVEVAKWRFLQAHPGRHRSPRGFTDGISLKLTGIEEGSAIPVISLVIAANTLFAPENQVYFEEARNAVVSAISAAEKNTAVVQFLPEKTLSYFDRMGRSLRDGEAIEFTTPTHTVPARLTKETRRRLVLASSNVNELTEETTIRGAVPEADQDDMSFEVQLMDGQKIPAPIATPHMETILDAFNGYKRGVRVLVDGVGKFNRNGRLQGFESIEHVNLLDPLDVGGRLDELRVMKDGWLDGKGLAPAPAGLDWLANAFEERYPEDLPLPFLYPTAEGGIQAEWSHDPNEVSIEIDLASKTGEWHLLSMQTQTEETRSLKLDQDNDWKWLIARIREIAGVQA